MAQDEQHLKKQSKNTPSKQKYNSNRRPRKEKVPHTSVNTSKPQKK